MNNLDDLFNNNRRWVDGILEEDPHFFEKLSKQQTPEYLWIGCSDSRVPANDIVGLLPGELFVHRNIANAVIHTDINCQTVIQYAVEYLKVKHIIVCGHYGCSGIKAAMGHQRLGLIDNWLRHIRDINIKHEKELFTINDEQLRWDRLCELNVIEQVYNVCHSSKVQIAWESGQTLSVHGWIYSIKDGLLKDLNVSIDNQEQISERFHIRVS